MEFLNKFQSDQVKRTNVLSSSKQTKKTTIDLFKGWNLSDFVAVLEEK